MYCVGRKEIMSTKFGVIFDFDGTALDSLPLYFKATRLIFLQHGVSPPTYEQYLETLEYPTVEYFAKRGIFISPKEMKEHVRKKVPHKEALLFKDVERTLQALKERDVALAIASCQKKSIVRWHCAAHKIARHFNPIIAGCMSKVQAIETICRMHGLEKKRTVLVGDFIWDMRDAKEAHVWAVGIARGVPGLRRRLMDAGAHYCIDSLDELVPILEKL